MRRLASLLSVLALAAAVACEGYEAPPEPFIVGAATGVVDDSRAPLVIGFGTAIDPATLKLTIALDETDIEGNLRDEDADPSTDLHVLIKHAPGSDLGATAMIAQDLRSIVLTPTGTMPVGPKLVLIVEAGLRSPSGRVSNRRVKIPFSYGVKCSGGATRLESGTYFMLLDVEKPLGLQIQIVAELTLDPKTGAIDGRFTSADRRTDLSCPTACTGDNICRLRPQPACVLPSELAGTIEEYEDFTANPTPPIGFSFVAAGCASDDAEGTGVLTAPATMTVESPPVAVQGLVLTARFAPSPDGVVRATGTLTADHILVGTEANPPDFGAGTGTMTARRIR